MFRMREQIIILGFPPVVCPSSNWGGICAVPTADAVATGEVNRSIPSVPKDPWLARMSLTSFESLKSCNVLRKDVADVRGAE